MASKDSPVSLYSQLDVSAGSKASVPAAEGEAGDMLRLILAAQDRTNELLEELVSTLGASQRQRNAELRNWREANPELASDCRQAAESLGRVQAAFLQRLTEEANEQAAYMEDGEFALSEFVDRFGPRLAHLNGVIQVLGQLSSSTARTSLVEE